MNNIIGDNMKKIIISVFIIGGLLVSCNYTQSDLNVPIESISVTPGPSETPPLGDGQNDGRELIRGNVFVNSLSLSIMESYPIQVSIAVEGELPTPCNVFASNVVMPDENNEIHVDMYTLIDPAETCIAMIQPFNANVPIPLDSVIDGNYSVWVNGEKVGEFTYPGG